MTTTTYIKQYPRVLAILRDKTEADVVALAVSGSLTLDCFGIEQEIKWAPVFIPFGSQVSILGTLPIAAAKKNQGIHCFRGGVVCRNDSN